ncbi:helix-turn-helix domain-containing protein [Pseudohaliea sp.]|uniref:helix-turn-helix domain-containing protein n=1 Tax=Pseudohaliea sp. TaxID=2740289 RepID=UPI0032EC5274
MRPDIDHFTQLAGQLHTLHQIARKGHISVKTIRRLIQRGELKSHRIGTQIRVSEADWQAYLDWARQP